MTNNEIFVKSLELSKWNREQRDIVLKEHNLKYRTLKQELWQLCEKETGHHYSPLTTGSARPHFITGEWPHRCQWCGKEMYK